MPVRYDTSSYHNSSGAPATGTLSGYTSSGENRCAVVFVYVARADGGAISCTYGGVAMTKLRETTIGSIRVAMFVLTQQLTGAQDVVATWTLGSVAWSIHCVSFMDVDPLNPAFAHDIAASGGASITINTPNDGGHAVGGGTSNSGITWTDSTQRTNDATNVMTTNTKATTGAQETISVVGTNRIIAGVSLNPYPVIGAPTGATPFLNH